MTQPPLFNGAKGEGEPLVGNLGGEPIIDTHCHLYMDAFDHDREAVIARAKEFGVKYLVNVGVDPKTNAASYELAKAHDAIFHTAGFHPHSADEFNDAAFRETAEFAKTTKPVAIGEIGLDYFKSQSSRENQKKCFSAMVGLALELDLPVVVHSRDAFEDTLAVLKTEGRGKLRGVMHCFSYDAAAAAELFDLGFMISFTCNLTFKNAGSILDVAKSVPLERFMLETDSPYLAPQIYRGKRNEPCCLVHLADFLAERRGVTAAAIRRATSENAVRFFGLEGRRG